MDRKKKWVAAGLAAIVLLGGGVAVLKMRRPHFDGDINALGVDLSAPFAYVSTPALSRLPRDIVQAPVVRDVLTEDFAFYYEEQEDRLSLRGAIKRIAYERETNWSDQLLATALDASAEMAWWPDAKGAPRYWALTMTRGAVATALQGMASIAAKDSQLSIIGTLQANGSAVNAYALALSPRRTLVLLSQGNRVVVLSDPGLLFNDKSQASGPALEVVAGLLSGDTRVQSAWRRGFGLPEQAAAASDSEIVVDARLLSFGYQHFFPGMQAIRFDVAPNGGALRTALRVKAADTLPAAPGDRALWSALPADPAACALLPVEWAQMEKLVKEAPAPAASAAADPGAAIPKAEAIKALADQFEGPAAVCWYARSQLQTPLFVAQLKASAGPEADTALASLARWMIAAGAADGAPAAGPDAGSWQRQVKGPWGPYADGDDRAYKPTLTRQGRWVAFSPDDKLVELALNTQGKRYPSVADTLPSAGGGTLVVGAPAQIADLLQREAMAVLPADQEILRQAARQHLVPRLDALRKLPPARAVAQGAGDGSGWVPVEWQAMSAAPTPAAPQAK